MTPERIAQLRAEFEKLEGPCPVSIPAAHTKWLCKESGFLLAHEKGQVGKDAERLDFVLKHASTRRAIGGGFELSILLPCNPTSIQEAIDAAIEQEKNNG